MNVILVFLRLYGRQSLELALSVLAGYSVASLIGNHAGEIGSAFSALRKRITASIRVRPFPISWRMRINWLAMTLAFLLGYMTHALVRISHLYTLTDVRILQKYDNLDYRVQTEEGEPFVLKFCGDYAPGFDPGMTLRFIIYEDRGACKSIAPKGTGFKVERDIATGRFVDFRQEK